MKKAKNKENKTKKSLQFGISLNSENIWNKIEEKGKVTKNPPLGP